MVEKTDSNDYLLWQIIMKEFIGRFWCEVENINNTLQIIWENKYINFMCKDVWGL